MGEGATVTIQGISQSLQYQQVFAIGEVLLADGASLNVKDITLGASILDLGELSAIRTEIPGLISYDWPNTFFTLVVTHRNKADSDNDGLPDINEVLAGYSGTLSDKADSDNDLLTDGFEVKYGLNPWLPDDITSDADNDGLNLLDEQIFGTDPFSADTDGDGTSDATEANAGGNPNDPSDGGIAPPTDELITLRLTVGDPSGSASERYVLKVGRISHQSEYFGAVSTRDYRLRLSEIDFDLPVSILHMGSLLELPNYDYIANVQLINGPATGFMYCLHDPEGILGTHGPDGLEFYARGRQAILATYLRVGIQWHHEFVQKHVVKFEKVLSRYGKSINDAEFGKVLPERVHQSIRVRWQQKWDDYWATRNPDDVTLQGLDTARLNFLSDPAIAAAYTDGASVGFGYSRWNGLSAAEKMHHFAAARKGQALLYAALAGYADGIIDEAKLKVSPALVFTNEATRQEYTAALTALQECSLVLADRNTAKDRISEALLGVNMGTPLTPVLVIDQNPDTIPSGIVPKILDAYVGAFPPTLYAMQAALSKAEVAIKKSIRDYECDCDQDAI